LYSSEPVEEKTEIIGQENTLKAILKVFSNVKEKLDVYADSDAVYAIFDMDAIKNAYYKLQRRNIKVRLIVEITKNNMSYCKGLMKFSEVRHLDGVKGSFAISETEYIDTTVIIKDAKLQLRLTHSNNKSEINHHQYLFDILWNKSLSAEQKIKEIEEGERPEITEVIYDSQNSIDKYQSIIKNAKKEILLVVPIFNKFDRLRNTSITDLLIEVYKSSKTKVRIIAPLYSFTIKKDIESYFNILANNHDRINISVRFIESNLDKPKSTTLIADRQNSITMELKEDSSQEYHESIGPSTYSNSKLSVLSYVFIFENLWSVTELYSQVKESNENLEKRNSQLEDMGKRLIKSYIELINKDKELQILNEEIIKINKSKEEFIAMIIHELKTPLVSIKGYSDLLLKPNIIFGGLNEKQKKAISIIQRNVEKQMALVEDVLDVYKLDVGNIGLRKQDVNIIKLIEHTIADLNPLAIERQVKLEADVKIPPVIENNVYCEPSRIEQVLSNLIKNSLDFVPQKSLGKIVIRVEKIIDANKNNNQISNSPNYHGEFLFTVEDNGIGIPIDKSDNLFKKFYQLDTSPTRKHVGTGLGLVICKGIIESHGGRMWVDKTYTNGVRICFTIPIEHDKIGNNK
jgi:two-component system, OmpR family, sensor histidine kinase VicK